jgi:hypothetical protein
VFFDVSTAFSLPQIKKNAVTSAFVTGDGVFFDFGSG